MGQSKDNPRQGFKHASRKSLRLDRGKSRRCHLLFCRQIFKPRRKDHKFCSKECRQSFYKIKYGLNELAGHFELQIYVKGRP